jgi:hypothetical protein
MMQQALKRYDDRPTPPINTTSCCHNLHAMTPYALLYTASQLYNSGPYLV